MSRIGHLQIYLGNRCNLSCRYCYVAINQGEAKRLDFPVLASAIDLFLKSSAPGPKRVSLLGGEPLLQLPVVLRAVDHLRRAAREPVAVNLYTNGTRLTPRALASLSGRGVFTILSLDGGAESDNRDRVFVDGRPAFSSVLKRLASLPKTSMGVNMVLTAANAARLTENAGFFHRLGFRSINFYPEIYASFSDEDLASLGRALERFADYYESLFKAGRDPFTIPALETVMARPREEAPGSPWWSSCDKLPLGPDGRFHACDKAMSFAPERMAQSAVGSPSRGLDWERREALFEDARRRIDGLETPGPLSFCPMGIYFHGLWNGEDPRSGLENFVKVDRVFARSLRDIERRLRAHPLFRAAYRLPKEEEPAHAP